MEKGLLIALEGIDQSGKKTQARLLAERLKGRGYEVELIAFPDYFTPTGAEIRAFLEGERNYGPIARQVLYMANRWERAKDIEGWLSRGRVVIADRYSQSGIAYGYASGLDLDWMLNLERGLPKTDLVIVIDVPVSVAMRRKLEKDVYERDAGFLTKVRTSYLELAEKLGWMVVDGNRLVSEIHEDIWKAVVEKLPRKPS
jgi:dTMP kinase